MKFVDLSYKQFKTTDIARCLKARYTAAPTNHACEDSGVLIGGENMEVRAVLTPDREEKRQNGRRMKEDGEPMFTLAAQDRHGVAIIDDQGRANKKLTPSDICPTLRAQSHGNEPKVIGEVECNDGNAKERNTFEILCLLRKEIGEKAFTEWGIAIVAPFQQAEVLRQGVHEKSFSENREEQSDIQQRTYNSEIDKQVDYKRNCLSKMWDNAEFRCSPCGRGLYQQFREEFDCALQKLSHENPSSKEFMYSLWQASEGIRVLREALSEIQEIRGRIDVQWKKSVRIRRLTPREVWRLQGFPDEYFDKAKAAGISDSQLYKMAGNAVTVNVARAIGEKLKEIEDEET